MAAPPATASDAFPPSAREAMLCRVIQATKPETQSARITKIVAEAERGRRALG